MFQELVSSKQIKQFIKEGYLSEVKQFVGYCPDLSRVNILGKDYNSNDLADTLSENKYIAKLVESYEKFAKGKKTIIFASNIEHSQMIADSYKDAGYNFIHLDGKTSKEERELILKNFAVGKIVGIVNCDIVSEGFDVPDTECVQLAAPTKSLAKYLQRVGRALRPTKTKEFAIILDNANCWLEHGLATSDRDWTLKPTKYKKKEFVTFEEEKNENDIVVKRVVKRVLPQEMEGIELKELDEEMVVLIQFEKFLQTAIERNYKIFYSWYKYVETRTVRDVCQITQNEFDYITNRLTNLYPDIKQGFFFHKAKELNLQFVKPTFTLKKQTV